MIAVVVSLVAVVLLVLVVVALGVRSMSRRESSLPPERLKEMAEKEEKTHARSTDEFAAHEPRMANFSPDFSPIDAPKPKPVRTGQRGKRGVDEWGNPTNDDDDEEFWANIRSDAEQGGFGAGGTVAARKASARPGDREQPPAAEPQRPGQRQRPAQPQRQAAERRKAKPQPVAAAADPDAATVQAPLPQRQPAAAANLADLVEPAKRATPAQPDMAEQRTVTFAAPTPDVMSILGAGAQPVPAARPEPTPTTRPQPAVSSNAFPGGSYPATPAASAAQANSGAFPVSPPLGTGSSFPAAGPTSSGSFPAAQPAPIHGAPTSDPFPAYTNAADPLETTRTGPRTPATPSASGSWPAVGTADILDDPTPAPSPSPAPSSYASGSSWPAFEQPARSSYPASYEVRTGWAVADDSEPLPNTTSATGTPTTPSRAVSAYDDVLSASTPQSSFPAYETGDITTAPGVAWPEPPAANGSQANLPAAGYGGTDMFGNTTPPQPSNGRRRPSDKDHPHDYYR